MVPKGDPNSRNECIEFCTHHNWWAYLPVPGTDIRHKLVQCTTAEERRKHRTELSTRHKSWALASFKYHKRCQCRPHSASYFHYEGFMSQKVLHVSHYLICRAQRLLIRKDIDICSWLGMRDRLWVYLLIRASCIFHYCNAHETGLAQRAGWYPFPWSLRINTRSQLGKIRSVNMRAYR